jgi:two-component system, NarL family, response regulator YdfI
VISVFHLFLATENTKHDCGARTIATGASIGTGKSACATCMINVLVKASSPIAKAGLESLLRPYSDLRLVEDLSKHAREVESEFPADVLLVEADTLSDPGAREALDWAGAGAAAVLLIRNPAAEPVAEALRAGLKAVLPSDLDGSEIRAAIEAAALGLTVLESTSLDLVLRAPSRPVKGTSGTLVEPLTERELEVLELVAAGLGNKEVAARLEISEHTVKFHVASIMGKLGAGSRTEAVTLGIRHGLIMI